MRQGSLPNELAVGPFFSRFSVFFLRKNTALPVLRSLPSLFLPRTLSIFYSLHVLSYLADWFFFRRFGAAKLFTLFPFFKFSPPHFLYIHFPPFSFFSASEFRKRRLVMSSPVPLGHNSDNDDESDLVGIEPLVGSLSHMKDGSSKFFAHSKTWKASRNRLAFRAARLRRVCACARRDYSKKEKYHCSCEVTEAK